MYKVLLQTGDRTFKDLAGKFLPHFEQHIELRVASSIEKVVEEMTISDMDVIVVDHDGTSVDFFETMNELTRLGINVPSILLYNELDADQISHAVDYRVDGMMQRGRTQPHTFFRLLMDKIILSSEKNRTRVERTINEKRMEALIHMAKMGGKDFSTIVNYALEKSVELTRSSIGYVSLYDRNKRKLKMLSWSTNAMERCHMTNIPMEFDLDNTGVWGEPIRQRNTVVMNNYNGSRMIHKKGLPHGHVPLTRILMVPIFYDGHIVGTAGVGNKNDDYTWFDEVQLDLLMKELFAIYYNIETVKSYSKQASLINDLISLGPVGMMFISDNMDIILLNDIGAKVLDCTPIVSNSIAMDDLRSPNLDKVREVINQVNLDGESHSIRLVAVIDNVQRMYEATVSCMDQNSGMGFAVVFNDVTEIQMKDDVINRALDHIKIIEGPVFRTISTCRDELLDLDTSGMNLNQVRSITKLDGALKFMNDYRDVGIERPVWMDLQSTVEKGMQDIDFSDISLNIKTSGIRILADAAFPLVFKNLFNNSLKYRGYVTEISITRKISEGWLYIIYSDNGDSIACEMNTMILNQMKDGRFGLFLIDDIVSASGFKVMYQGDGVGTSFEIRVPANSYSLG